jgi:hypothetical protein
MESGRILVNSAVYRGIKPQQVPPRSLAPHPLVGRRFCS